MKREAFTLLLSILLITSCGKDSSKEALKAYEGKDYSAAIRLFKELHVNEGNDTLYQKELALSYMYRGKELFAKTRNIGTFAGNFEQAEKYIPEPRNGKFKLEYSQLLVDLADAYRKARPGTELEKEEFFDQSLNTVQKAIEEDSTNQSALNLLEDIKQEHFSGLIQRGKDHYNKVRKTGQLDLYYISESVFRQAAKLEPDNKEINKYLNLIRKKTFGILNYRDGLALAVTKFKKNRGKINLNVVVKNYTPVAVNFKPENLALRDAKGRSYELDQKTMKQDDLLGVIILKESVLNDASPVAEGALVYTVPDSIQPAYIAYPIKGGGESRKYFP